MNSLLFKVQLDVVVPANSEHIGSFSASHYFRLTIQIP